MGMHSTSLASHFEGTAPKVSSDWSFSKIKKKIIFQFYFEKIATKFQYSSIFYSLVNILKSVIDNCEEHFKASPVRVLDVFLAELYEEPWRSGGKRLEPIKLRPHHFNSVGSGAKSAQPRRRSAAPLYSAVQAVHLEDVHPAAPGWTKGIHHYFRTGQHLHFQTPLPARLRTPEGVQKRTHLQPGIYGTYNSYYYICIIILIILIIITFIFFIIS